MLSFFSGSTSPEVCIVRVLYDPLVPASLSLDTSMLRPGMRLAVGLSGGADSVALLCALAERNREPGRELGLVLHAVHLHHGLRGEEADADLEFSQALAQKLGVPFHHARVDTAAEAAEHNESIEEAARRLRYAWFRRLLSESLPDAVSPDAIATAHTLDDQAETVLAKFLRGAWTEGLSGIHPVLEFAKGKILRPFLGTTRVEIEAFLRQRNQPWREDSTNRQLTFTRNRIRHELLPQLETWNPRLSEHLAHMAELSRDEETWATAEVQRIARQLILPGRPVRGGGRSATEELAVDVVRLAELPVALQRRLLRLASEQCGVSIDFVATEALRRIALRGHSSQKLELLHGLLAERTHRELRFTRTPLGSSTANSTKVATEVSVPVPGAVDAPAFSLRIQIANPNAPLASDLPRQTALLRCWKAGDRVQLRHSSAPRKVKEVLERMKVTGSDRAAWPVLEYAGRIVWMKGVEVEPDPGFCFDISASTLPSASSKSAASPPPK